MTKTKHIQQRMSQRGVTNDVVDFVINNGLIKQDKYYLNRKEILKMLADTDKTRKILTKMLDKGGVVVVADGENLITTYNFDHI